MTVAPTALLDSPQLSRYGLPFLAYGESPAVATDFTQQVTGHDYVRLLSVFCRLVADANAANREVVLEYRDADNRRYALAGAPVVVTANSTEDYAFNAFQGQAEWQVDTSVLVPLLPMLLPPGHNWRLHIVNAQAGDQLSRVRFVQELFFTTGPAPGLGA